MLAKRFSMSNDVRILSVIPKVPNRLSAFATTIKPACAHRDKRCQVEHHRGREAIDRGVEDNSELSGGDALKRSAQGNRCLSPIESCDGAEARYVTAHEARRRTPHLPRFGLRTCKALCAAVDHQIDWPDSTGASHTAMPDPRRKAAGLMMTTAGGGSRTFESLTVEGKRFQNTVKSPKESGVWLFPRHLIVNAAEGSSNVVSLLSLC